MIFTVGNRTSYQRGLAEHHPLEKLGKGKDHQGRDYGGGCTFKSEDAARGYLHAIGAIETYEVYGLEADWDTDTEQLPGEPYRRLLRDAVIVDLAQGAPQ